MPAVQRFFRSNLLVVQTVAVFAVTLLLMASAFLVLHGLRDEENQARVFSQAALLASQVQGISRGLAPIEGGLSLESLRIIPDEPLGGIPVTRVLATRQALTDAREKAAEANRLVPGQKTIELTVAANGSVGSLDALLRSPSDDSLAGYRVSLATLEAAATSNYGQLADGARRQEASFDRGANLARWSLCAAAVAAVTAILTTTYVVARRFREAAAQALLERDHLAVTSAVVERRNSQFQSLYKLVTEVTDSLNTRYVVAAAVREARSLVDADVVAIRLLHDDELVLVGSQASEGIDLSALTTLALGEGLVGRAAKRGKTIRLNSEADQWMGENERVPGMESGLAVPLIVGARVVGTLGCWSHRPSHFDDEDERILEMMASQVATAVAAADAHEASEHRASHDALTNLPNRRQLNEDMSGVLADFVIERRPFAIAMLDIDNFRVFNNEFGHKVGDITLQKVAQVLKSSVRENDRVYRYGGEEFLLFFADTDARGGIHLAERVRAAVQQMPMTGEELQPVGPIMVSAGVAAFPEHGADIELLTERADFALLQAKQSGRNRVSLWRPGLDAPRLLAA